MIEIDGKKYQLVEAWVIADKHAITDGQMFMDEGIDGYLDPGKYRAALKKVYVLEEVQDEPTNNH